VGGKIALAVGVAGVASYAARGRSAGVFAPSVWHGPRSRRAIALTFDDGPSPSTSRLLDVLDSYGVKATFFQCGMHVRRLPEIARAVAEGKHEIGNHTHSHNSLWLRSPDFILREIGEAQQAIESAAGVKPILFRAPYGVRWFGLRAAQQRFGLLGVMWTVLARDWKLPAPLITSRLLQGAENGAIFCLHDGRERAVAPDITCTITAIRETIPRLRDLGYQFRTVSQLLQGGSVQ